MKFHEKGCRSNEQFLPILSSTLHSTSIPTLIIIVLIKTEHHFISSSPSSSSPERFQPYQIQLKSRYTAITALIIPEICWLDEGDGGNVMKLRLLLSRPVVFRQLTCRCLWSLDFAGQVLTTEVSDSIHMFLWNCLIKKRLGCFKYFVKGQFPAIKYKFGAFKILINQTLIIVANNFGNPHVLRFNQINSSNFKQVTENKVPDSISIVMACPGQLADTVMNLP